MAEVKGWLPRLSQRRSRSLLGPGAAGKLPSGLTIRGAAVYARTVRALTETEERRLRRRLLVHEGRRPSLRKPALAALGVCGALWILTVLASKLILWPTLAWVSVGTGLTFWIWGDERRRHTASHRRLKTALSANRVEEITIGATEVVEFEEIEDLGASWAFQVEPDAIVFVRSQDLPRGFPSTDFSMTFVQDGGGEVVDGGIALRGEKVLPVRRVSVAVQRGMRLPATLELLPGRLADLENLLARPPTSA